MHDYTSFYIDGEWITPDSERSVIDVENPATGATIGRALQAAPGDVDRAVAAARAAFESYSQYSRDDRLSLLDRVIEVYKRRQDEISALITAEMGASKRISDADFDTAVRNGTRTCMANVGQSCDPPTRMLVANDRMDDAVRIATEAARSLPSVTFA